MQQVSVNIQREQISSRIGKLTVWPIQRLGDDRLCEHAGSNKESWAEQAYSYASDDPFLPRVRICEIGRHAGRRGYTGRVRPRLGVGHLMWYRRVGNRVESRRVEERCWLAKLPKGLLHSRNRALPFWVSGENCLFQETQRSSGRLLDRALAKIVGIIENYRLSDAWIVVSTRDGHR